MKLVDIKHLTHKVFLLWHHHWKGDQPRLKRHLSPRGKTDPAGHNPIFQCLRGEHVSHFTFILLLKGLISVADIHFVFAQ